MKPQKYRKKPVIVEAAQWFPGREIVGVKSRPMTVHKDRTYYYVETLEGELAIMPGDWVITGVKGEKCPCKPDIFEMTYEPVE